MQIYMANLRVERRRKNLQRKNKKNPQKKKSQR
jgi:hypothetical protein